MRCCQHIVTGCLAAGLSVSADAQYVSPDIIGQTVVNALKKDLQRDCLGRWSKRSEEDTAPARLEAESLMKAYLDRTAGSQAVDLREMYTRAFTKSWVHNGRAGKIKKVLDPLAQRIQSERLKSKLAAFILSREGKTAIGTWEVYRVNAGSSSERVGHYRSMFRKDPNSWRLMGVFVTEGSGEPLAVEDYCFVSGDIRMFEAQQRAKSQSVR